MLKVELSNEFLVFVLDVWCALLELLEELSYPLLVVMMGDDARSCNCRV